MIMTWHKHERLLNIFTSSTGIMWLRAHSCYTPTHTHSQKPVSEEDNHVIACCAQCLDGHAQMYACTSYICCCSVCFNSNWVYPFWLSCWFVTSQAILYCNLVFCVLCISVDNWSIPCRLYNRIIATTVICSSGEGKNGLFLVSHHICRS